jgi:tetratricopeptide (TPR) repeat protein
MTRLNQPRKTTIWLAPLAALLLAAAPVELPSLEKQLATAAALVDDGKSAEALAILDPLLASTEFPLEKGQIEGLRSFALARANRIPEARKAIEASVASNPAPTMLLLRQLFLLRAFTGDPKAAGETLLLIAASDPKGLNTLPTEIVTDVLRAAQTGKTAADKDRAFELDYALVTAGWAPADATLADLDWLRLRLATSLADRGRLDDARPVIAQMLNPVVLVRLGIDRRFASLWPDIEKRLGPGADIADAAYVGAAKERFDKKPDSLIARLGYAEALNIASREPEATVVADIAKTPEELARLTEREIWLVNLHAELLGDAGKADAAMARLAALNATPISTRPGMVGTVISEVLLAQSLGRYKEALQLADAAEAKLTGASDYGRLYLAHARACALVGLGRKEEAVKAAAPLIDKPEANDESYLAAMICLGRMDAAAAAIIRRLGDPDDRAAMLFNMQPFLINDRPIPRDVPYRTGMRALKARPDVKAAYLKAGRDLPAAVAPPR